MTERTNCNDRQNDDRDYKSQQRQRGQIAMTEMMQNDDREDKSEQ